MKPSSVAARTAFALLTACSCLAGAPTALAAASAAPPRQTVQDHRSQPNDDSAGRHAPGAPPRRPAVRDHRGAAEPSPNPTSPPPAPRAESPEPRKGYVWIPGRYEVKDGESKWVPGHWERARAEKVHEAIELQPKEPEDKEEVIGVTPRGPILGSGDFPLATIQDNYWGGKSAGEFYYLPRAFHLARDPAGGYGVSAVWTNDQNVLLTLTLRADVDPAEFDYAQELVQAKEGSSARLYPLPYDGAEIVDLEVMEGWHIDEIKVPSFGSLNASIPLAIKMTPDSFANLKPLLETEGIGAGVVVKSGDQSNHVDVKISLRYPSGRAYSPIQDIDVGYDRRRGELVLTGVTNHLDFPFTIDGVDIEIGDPAWPEPDVYSGLRLETPVLLAPGETASVAIPFGASQRLRHRLGAGAAPASGDRESTTEVLLTEILKSVLEGRGRRDRDEKGEAKRERTRPRELVSLDDLVQRYRLRFTPDYSCQACYDRIWGDLEVVSYIERLRRLRVEILEAAYAGSYGDSQLDTVKVDLRSLYFSPNPGDSHLLHSVSLSREHTADESVGIYLPRGDGDPLTYEYRLTAFMADGTRLQRAEGWSSVEDSLQLLISAADIHGLSGN